MLLTDNLLLLTDSYKTSHSVQYPPGTQQIFSYFESRGGEFDNTVFFGLQYFIQNYLVGEVVTSAKIAEASVFCEDHGVPFNRKGWEYIVDKHNGRLPIVIKAVPEGLVVPTGNVLMTVENLDPNCFWLTNYLESLLVQVWYPSTVATLSRECKKLIKKYLKETSTDTNADFKLHDFGFRGVSSVESAAIGGAAHLVNFKGTDTMVANILLRKFYGEKMAGYSIPASEHSTITSWGKEHEVGAYRNMLEKYPTGLVTCVSDSYDINKACSELWGTELKDMVLARNGTLVIRPDSGEPVESIMACLTALGKAFGFTVNAKGYKVLPPQVRLIQGDGVEYHTIGEILETMKQFDWAAENVAFGMGGGLLQKLNRDTQKFAFKCSLATVDDTERDVFKSPVGSEFKTSKKGRLELVQVMGSHGSAITTKRIEDVLSSDRLLLKEVFVNGMAVNAQDLAAIRQRAAV